MSSSERSAPAAFFGACRAGDIAALRDLLERDPALVRERTGDGATGLHLAVRHPDAVRLLLERGADPNARDTGDHALPLHCAAGGGPYVVAPADGLVGGLFRTGDHYRTLQLLIELGADLDARDAKGRTPLAVAMLRGDREAMRLVHAAGAKQPDTPDAPRRETPETLATSIRRLTPMLGVPDLEATVAWYRSIGFELAESHGEEGRMDWACVTFGPAAIMLVPSGDPWRGPTARLSLWVYTDRLDDLYVFLTQRQLERSRASLAGEPSDVPEVRFTQDLHTAFYGLREFGIRDPNGVELMFAQPVA